MRLSTLAGLVLLVAGLFILVRGGTFTTREDVIDIGGLTVTAKEQRPIEPWIAGAAVIGGIVLLVYGVRSKGSSSRF